MAHALLIGNGINRAADDTEWRDLLSMLRHSYTIDKDVFCNHFTMEYDRIYFSGSTAGLASKEYVLKQKIAQELPVAKQLYLHQLYSQLPVSDILTTNYDYNLERAIDDNFDRKQYPKSTHQRLYSVSRNYSVNRRRIWHIHGEVACPDSICLGFTQYCSYISVMYRHLFSTTAESCGLPYLDYFLRQKEQGRQQKYWMTVFFTHDIYIVGLGLCFLELDLWWLLNLRMRYKLEYPQYKIKNRIYYFYDQNESAASQDQLAMLKSMDVILMPRQVQDGNWSAFYQSIYHKLQTILDV